MAAETSGCDGGEEAGRDVGGEGGDLLAEVGDAVGEDGGALRGLALPEGQAGRGAVGVFDEDAAGGLDALDAPAGVAEEDDVAGAGVDGEVFIQSCNLDVFGLEEDAVEGGVGDGAAVGDGGHAGAAAGVEMAVDAVAEEVGAVAAAAGLDAGVEQGEDLVEAGAGEVAVGVGAAEDLEEGVFLPGLGGAAGDDLLHEDVDGLVGDLEAVELAGAHLADEGGLLEEVVAGGGEEAALGDGAAPVAGAADALHGDGDGAGGADLADEVDVADVDAELERGGGDEDADLAGLEALLGVEAEVAGERAVVGGDLLGAEAGAELEGDLFDEAAGVDEDQRGAMALGVGGELVEDLGPHVVGGDGAEFVAGDLDGEV